MTSKRKITDKNGTQVFPITHTRAVIDDNGNCVEQRLQEQMDVINQKQLEVGAVPSDITPIAGSTNWVTSGGVKSALDALENTVDTNKADKDGYYATLCVGQADDLKDTIGEVKEVMNDTMNANGSLSIITIQGNLVKWNQFGVVKNFDYSATNSTDGVVYKRTYQKFLKNSNDNLTSNHKFYVCFDYTINASNDSGSSYLYFYQIVNANKTENQVLTASDLSKEAGDYRKEYILPIKIQSSVSQSQDIEIYIYLKAGKTVDFSIANFMAIDLTMIFGEGNEPRNTSAVKAWIKGNIGSLSWYTQNLGCFIPMTMTGIKSVGGSGQDAFVQVVNANVSEMTGTLNGGSSVAMFADGMFRIGDVYDEITGGNAVRRIGRRAYEDGDTDGDDMLTDGNTTYYVLDDEELYVLDNFELPKNVLIANGGTLSLLPVNEASPTTTAPYVFIQKTMNAVELIKKMLVTNVSIEPQLFTDFEKGIARNNIRAASIADFEESMNEIENVDNKTEIKQLYSLMESGSITMNSKGWTYTDSTNRIRTKEDVTIRMYDGDKISLTRNVSGNTFYVGKRSLSTGKYSTSGGWVNSWTADERCDIVLVVQNAGNPVEWWTDRVVITRAEGNNVTEQVRQRGIYGRGNLTYYGNKVDLGLLRRNICVRNNFVEMYHTIDGQPSDGYYTRLNQSMAISNRRVFLFNDTTGRGASHGGVDIVVLDYDTKKVIYKGITGTWSAAHHNNAQFFSSRYKYDPNDKYPLLLLSRGNHDSTGVIAYIIRVQETESDGEYSFSFTILKTINVDVAGIPEAANNGSMCIDEVNRKIYMYSTRQYYTTTANNWLIINSFDFDSVGLDNLSGSVTLRAEDVVSRKDLNYFISQGGCCYGGKLFLPLQSASSVNTGFTPIYDGHFVAVIDPATGTIESIIPSAGMENEGIAWYLGKMYVSIKNGNATEETTTPMFRIYEYVL